MSELKALTERQREIYEFIREQMERNGYPPTIREIGKHFDIKSPNGVMCHLKALGDKGYIDRKSHRARAIQIDDVKAGGATIQLLGRVAAGHTIEAPEQSDTRIDLHELFCDSNHFALQVAGESMIDDHIEDGDLVIIRKQKTAENGDRVVARIDNEVTLKVFEKKRDHIRLMPRNASMPPIIVEPSSNFEIVGVLVGVLRRC